MFTNLFFLFLVLIIISYIPEVSFNEFISPLAAFEVGLIIYGGILLLLYFQIRLLGQKSKSAWFMNLVNLELIIFLGIAHIGLGINRFWENWLPYFPQTCSVLFSLCLYFIAAGWNHYLTARAIHFEPKIARSYAFRQLQLIVPFALPFIFFSGILEIVQRAPEASFWHSDLFLGILNFPLLALMLIFAPPLMITCWQCQPLEDPYLVARLQMRCTQMHFKHAGIKVWKAMKDASTAAIIGVVPRFRYLLFTQKLLAEFSDEEIEAVLIHEIGHNRYKHLLIYPFILFGMLVVIMLFSTLVDEPLIDYFINQRDLSSSKFWMIGIQAALFTLYALIAGIYFRLVFGFFSRLFERQADLTIFETTLDPLYMIKALDHIGIITGYTHDQPNWHHFSIRERINFLKIAIQNPQLVSLYHQRVRVYVWIYFYTLGLISFALWLYTPSS